MSDVVPLGHLTTTHRRLVEAAAEAILVDRAGGASVEKLLDVAALIVGEGVGDILEIGVYRGRFLCPLAALLEQLGRGHAIGVDPLEPAAATQPVRDLPAQQAVGLNDWVADQDWDQIYAGLLASIDELGIAGRCTIHRTTSEQAAPVIADESVDLLHVDGNHGAGAVRRDCALYLPKLRRPGYVVLDDVSWPGVAPIANEMGRTATRIFERHAGGDDYVVFQTRG